VDVRRAFKEMKSVQSSERTSCTPEFKRFVYDYRTEPSTAPSLPGVVIATNTPVTIN
jgi:hypothetical protein